MSDLTDFLLARIAEDEERSLSGAHGRPDRVARECEAKRRIVEREVDSRTKITYRRRLVLQDLASIYADHPDYREEWKP